MSNDHSTLHYFTIGLFLATAFLSGFAIATSLCCTAPASNVIRCTSQYSHGFIKVTCEG